MQFSLSVIAITTLSSLFGIAYAAGDLNAGKLKAAACEGCHGQNSKNPMAPKLAGQPQGYIAQQLTQFKDGSRKDPIMNSLAAGIKSAQDIDDIATYYASLPYQKKSDNQTAAALAMGKLFYNNKCAMCHNTQGNTGKRRSFGSFLGGATPPESQNMPLIENQPKLYLVKSLKDFRSGTRKSGNAFVMDIVAQRMTDKQINLVASYLSNSGRANIKRNSIARRD